MSVIGEAHDQPDAKSDARDESQTERLDRNTIELLNELRVAATGVQVLLAFLLIVPFNTGFQKLRRFDRYDYFVTLVCVACSAALLMSPSIHHRILFRLAQKQYLVSMGNRAAIIAMAFLTVGFTGIFVLIAHVIFGAAAAVIAGVVSAAVLIWLWFALPLNRRRSL